MTVVKETNDSYSVYDGSQLVRSGFKSAADAYNYINDILEDMYDDR